MKPLFLFRILLLLFVANCCAVFAQPVAAPSGRGEPDLSNFAPVADPRQTQSAAKTLAKGGNVRAAEEKLAELNMAPNGSSAWHLETGQRLLKMAGDLGREGAGNAVSVVVTQALQRLNEAETVARGANDAPAQARAKATAAHLHERYRGDTAAALAAYQAAVQLDPNDKGTKEALERLQRAHATMQARFEHNRRK